MAQTKLSRSRRRSLSRQWPTGGSGGEGGIFRNLYYDMPSGPVAAQLHRTAVQEGGGELQRRTWMDRKNRFNMFSDKGRLSGIAEEAKWHYYRTKTQTLRG